MVPTTSRAVWVGGGQAPGGAGLQGDHGQGVADDVVDVASDPQSLGNEGALGSLALLLSQGLVVRAGLLEQHAHAVDRPATGPGDQQDQALAQWVVGPDAEQLTEQAR
jgi:hypothetical protein